MTERVTRPGECLHEVWKEVCTGIDELYVLVDAIKSRANDIVGFTVNPAEEEETWEQRGELFTAWKFGFIFSPKNTGKGRTKSVGSLNITIDIAKEDGVSNVLGEAVLVVGWSPRMKRDVSDWDIESIVWPPEASEYGDPVLFSPYFLDWKYKNQKANDDVKRQLNSERTFFYIVPLEEIKSEDDIAAILFEPIISILNGEDIEKTIKRIPGVIQIESDADGWRLKRGN